MMKKYQMQKFGIETNILMFRYDVDFFEIECLYNSFFAILK